MNFRHKPTCTHESTEDKYTDRRFKRDLKEDIEFFQHKQFHSARIDWEIEKIQMKLRVFIRVKLVKRECAPVSSSYCHYSNCLHAAPRCRVQFADVKSHHATFTPRWLSWKHELSTGRKWVMSPGLCVKIEVWHGILVLSQTVEAKQTWQWFVMQSSQHMKGKLQVR